MDSRAAIEQAKGIIMATTGCGPDEAFQLLVRQSQHENRKLRELAEELVTRQRRP
jgi:AmiR/NasT family two-component response regulator